MTRAFLKSLFPKDMEGVDKIVDEIMDSHGTGIEAEKAKTRAVTEQATDLKGKITALEKAVIEAKDDSEAQKTLATVQAELDKVKSDLEKATTDHAAELKAEKDAHTATKNDYATEKLNGDMDKAVSASLKAAGYSEAAIPLFLKAGYDRTQLKQESDGKFTDVDKFVEALKTDPVHSTFFGTTQTVGADVGNPPHGGGSGEKNPWLKEHLSLSEQTRIYRENPQKARDLAKAAGVTLQ